MHIVQRLISSQVHLVIKHGENFYQIEWEAVTYLSFSKIDSIAGAFLLKCLWKLLLKVLSLMGHHKLTLSRGAFQWQLTLKWNYNKVT